MCGIAGIISQDTALVQPEVLQRMASCMLHRGPDSEGTWIAGSLQAGLAHRRLSVIDLSDAARQPMHLLGRFTIVYNGELFNYRELREQLVKEGVTFRTMSDTEVILAAYASRGYTCLEEFDGMFAFAIWDEYKKELFCARDRFGEKPFHFLLDQAKKAFVFGSELKGIYAAGYDPHPDESMLLGFLTLGQTNDPSQLTRTFDKRISRLPASHYLVFSPASFELRMVRHWNLQRETHEMDEKTATRRFHELFDLSVTRRLRSDVPVGVSLSGGLDSSAIAATLARTDVKELKAFTAVFPGFKRDESERAAIVAQQFGLHHLAVSMDAESFAADLEKLLAVQEEPFTSASVYAQYKVYGAAADAGVKVLLDGQGADETLGGYDKYLYWKRYTLLPGLTRNLLERRQRKIVNNDPFINTTYREAYAKSVGILKPEVHQLNDLLFYNIFTNGLEELLRYAVRNAMAHGREVRLPYLYHELVSFVFGLPDRLKIKDGFTKLLLRKAFEDVLPINITHNRRKIGFEPPQKYWMEHKTVKQMFMDARVYLVERGVLSKLALNKRLEAHDAYDRRGTAWKWLIAGMWLATNKKGV